MFEVSLSVLQYCDYDKNVSPIFIGLVTSANGTEINGYNNYSVEVFSPNTILLEHAVGA